MQNMLNNLAYFGKNWVISLNIGFKYKDRILKALHAFKQDVFDPFESDVTKGIKQTSTI